MNKLYNEKEEIVKGLIDFFDDTNYNFSKPQLKVLPNILTSLVLSENVTTSDISKVYSDNSLLTNNDSIQKKIWRFLNNPKFNGISFYNSVIKHIISNINIVKHSKLIVVMDHMYIKNNFVILMFSLRVSNSSIPIWFRCDKTKSNRHKEIDELTKKCLFSEKIIFQAIDDVISLLSKFNIKIIFLADRWFSNLKLMKYINDKGHYFCIRVKANSKIKILIYDKKEKHNIYKHLSDLPIQMHHSTYYKDIPLGNFKFKCNLSIARGKVSDDPWFILSNIEPNKTIKEYSKRFGTIETLFKNQKSNGFNLEKTKTKNIHALENLYSLVCFACTWLVIIGVDYTKNYNNIKNKLNVRCIKHDKNRKITRIISLFNLGLTIFRMVYNSYIDYKLKCNLKLYL